MSESSTPPKKPKFKRAWAPKRRSGCLTWVRHLKCDEEKPICRRCSDSGVKCDGYVVQDKKKRGKRPVQRVETLAIAPFAPQPQILETSIERCYFHHFHHWTCGQLTMSPDSSNFWITYVLPLAHISEPVKYAVTAVGAAHRFFIAGQDTRSPLQQLKGLAMQQYTKAITHIVPHMSLDTSYNIHCTLVCCLLFVAFEGITGRYTESIRHLQAGNRLLGLPALTSNRNEPDITRKLTELFSTLSVEASIFMEETIVPQGRPGLRTTDDDDDNLFLNLPFRDLEEAAYELKELDVKSVEIMDCCDSDDNDSGCPDEQDSAGCEGAGCWGCDGYFDELDQEYMRWDARFELTKALVATGELKIPESLLLLRLNLQQQTWRMGFYKEPYTVSGDECTAFLDAAEALAAALTAPGQPTFSLDGDLISGLSFIMFVSDGDMAIRTRTLNILRSLNRREGVWDSREVVEMHEAVLSLKDESWYENELPGGAPGYVAALARASKRINSTNSILQAAGYTDNVTSSPGVSF
ncbi:hypothetical protein FDECE_9367 [Fusarium decemcellulare]|nr:hypothetical protein FDECE_9367 [Fusarium decemcellulare]